MLKKSSLAVAINTLFLAPTIATAAPIDFANTPPGSGFKPPRPNVILTLDNSGSMGLMFEGERCVTREYLESPNTRSGHPYVRPGIDYFLMPTGSFGITSDFCVEILVSLADLLGGLAQY